MKEQNLQNDPVKSPEIQEMILSNRIGIISAELAKRLDIAPVRALQLFYESKTCADLHDKTTGLYLYGNLYIAAEFMREYTICLCFDGIRHLLLPMIPVPV